MENCPEAIDRVKRGETPFICGFDGKIPIVCCKLALTGVNETANVATNNPYPTTPIATKPQPLAEPKSSASKKSTFVCYLLLYLKSRLSFLIVYYVSL